MADLAAPPSTTRVEDLLARMTLQEKLAQLGDAERNAMHRRINARLHGVDEPATSAGGASVANGSEAIDSARVVSSFIRRRPLLGRISERARTRRVARLLLRLLAVWLIALTTLALLPDLAKLSLLFE